ncbi:hypothetical protein FOXG_18839 [Fusarium oxysporum f. sp. lycopersici 4287]|uniref:Uncharacterized protein n=2 Tax=Fusarium oxysporum TaxID=5507 RepID=A0A0J9UPG1_FUSO4|nr:hypothetical protein FOXG_18839 [Fusarium oxysporum f. sp. lycopersici 4287]EXK43743.1 hypothetical protein FOMG_02664 [Fusarium oxysporum f. sp. melonis 26406]KAJ9427628.1 hypothetical protein QL093DRAFT_2561285 [Fusarium oxysporum]KNB01170.1 hypothetical protein FOXG_18839 [Fusarium oxysporum f. sp. lycopersici 4287]
MEAIADPNCCQNHFPEQSNRHPAYSGEAKHTSSSQWGPWLHNLSNAPLHGCATPLSPKHDIESQCWSTNDTEDEDEIGDFSLSDHSLALSDLSQSKRLEVKTYALAAFSDWKEKMEYITPPENALPFQQLFRPSSAQPMAHTQAVDESDISDDELVVISRPTRLSRAFFHLACPFYVYDPEKCHQCLLTGDLRSVEDLIEHLFQFHSRPCYCMNCYETFDTQIRRDNHVLNEKCKAHTPGPLFGLAESQKAILLEIDTHHTSEKSCWFCIWSIVFPDSWEPRSPYLDQGAGLGVSMMRDFWGLYGSKCIMDSLTHHGIPRYEYQSLMGSLYHLVLEDLLNGI